MQNVDSGKNSRPENKTMAISITIFLLFFGIKDSCFGWFRAFSHSEEPVVYISIFCLSSFLSLVIFRRYRYEINIRSMIKLSIIGQAISMISLLASYRIFDAYYFLRILKSVNDPETYFGFLYVHAYWSFFLGGWLLVPLCDVLASAITKIKLKRELP